MKEKHALRLSERQQQNKKKLFKGLTGITIANEINFFAY
jgi:hypothetical protein